MLEKLSQESLPKWFQYPEKLIQLLASEDIDFGPWQLLHGKWLNVRNEGLKKRYPESELIPFARRIDDDDVACFVRSSADTPSVLVVHDFASPGWEKRDSFESFEAWFEAAKAELSEEM